MMGVAEVIFSLDVQFPRLRLAARELLDPIQIDLVES
ncbi:hypothetical protein N181_01915 [Sinorhizobium fredii USDA 205]|nr:hypothetical protein N181_01915 [Sinorhizobium fredii USDA 205]